MVSSNIEPADPDMWNLFDPIIDEVVLVKNGDGDIFWPDQGINMIGNWDVREGYQLFMEAPASPSFAGTEVDPALPLDLPAGWSLIAYLPHEPKPIEPALFAISDQLTLAKDEFGNVYWPAYGVNGIGDMDAGQGYQIFLTEPGTLIYPENGNFPEGGVLLPVFQ